MPQALRNPFAPLLTVPVVPALRKARLSAFQPSFLLRAVLVLLALYATSHEVLDNFRDFLSAQRFLHLLVFTALWTLTFIAVISIGLIRSAVLRYAWIGLIMLSMTLAQLSVVMTGNHINDDTLELVWNARYSSSAFLSAYWYQTAKVTALSLLLPFAIVALPYPKKSRNSSWGFTPLVPLLLLYGLFYYTGGVGTRGLPPQFSTLAVLGGWSLHAENALPKDEVRIARIAEPLLPHVLLIVDESIRADFLDINGASGVTPSLKQLQPQIINFGLASSGNNCTATSNAFLRMGASPRALQQQSDDLRRQPDIWRYAKQAGYRTHFIDNQRTGAQLQNYMDLEELRAIDEFHQLPNDLPRMRRDIASIETIREIQQREERSFIYMNKAGAHFHYESAYPPEERIFVPTLGRFEPASDRSRMRNSYKNAVHWSVDQFWKELYPQLDLSKTLVLYTSDHGQNLLDDAEVGTHCRLRYAREEEALVPLFVLTQHAALEARLRAAQKLNHNRANHFQIFPTLLELWGYDPAVVQEQYYLSLFEQVQQSPGFTATEVIRRFARGMHWRALQWQPVSFFGKE